MPIASGHSPFWPVIPPGIARLRILFAGNGLQGVLEQGTLFVASSPAQGTYVQECRNDGEHGEHETDKPVGQSSQAAEPFREQISFSHQHHNGHQQAERSKPPAVCGVAGHASSVTEQGSTGQLARESDWRPLRVRQRRRLLTRPLQWRGRPGCGSPNDRLGWCWGLCQSAAETAAPLLRWQCPDAQHQPPPTATRTSGFGFYALPCP